MAELRLIKKRDSRVSLETPNFTAVGLLEDLPGKV